MRFYAIIVISCLLNLFPSFYVYSFNFNSKFILIPFNNINQSEKENSNLKKENKLVDQNHSINVTFNTDSLSAFLKLQTIAFNIDSLDTVIFDLSKAMMVGNFIEFPVTFRSDDYIYALDFALKYNNQNIEFDSLINLTNGLNYIYYLNPNDSTLRFTSYRLGQMPNDTAVVKLRFTTQNGSICINDLNTINGYLNGDQCSYRVTDCDTTSTPIASIQGKSEISIYPNPASHFINLKIPEKYLLQIIDIAGNTMLLTDKTSMNEVEPIDISYLANGIYLLKITTESFSFVEKLLIQN